MKKSLASQLDSLTARGLSPKARVGFEDLYARWGKPKKVALSMFGAHGLRADFEEPETVKVIWNYG